MLKDAGSEDDVLHEPGVRRYRALFISDIHLGTRGCNAEMLIDFLDNVDSDMLYLVGDIIDGWQLKKRFYWPTAHNDVVWRVMKRAARIAIRMAAAFIRSGKRASLGEAKTAGRCATGEASTAQLRANHAGRLPAVARCS